MRGPKLNEGATVATMAAGERHGTKASAKYVRSSAYKARVVLDLIRGLDVRRADEVLQFTDRAIARDIRKVLASAVANATDPDNGAFIADADELFVLACFADEGPTLRRFRPRARGRATRIRKRTCHITIVVARMSDERLDVVQARAEGAGASAAASRRARVERSRKRAAQVKAGVDAVEADEDVQDLEDETADASTAAEGSADGEADGGSGGSEADASPDRREGSASVEDADAAETDAVETDDEQAGDEQADDEQTGDEQAETGADEVEAGFAPGEYAGSVLPDADGNGPDTHPIKGNADSMLYHTPDSRYYKVTKAEVWFDTEESAEAAGFNRPGSKPDNQSDED